MKFKVTLTSFIALGSLVAGQAMAQVPSTPTPASPDKAVKVSAEVGPTIDEALQPPTVPIKVTANGSDIHTVLASIFTQAKQQFVIEPGIHFALFLSLDGIPYPKALRIVCNVAGLETETVDGVVIVRSRTSEIPGKSHAQSSTQIKLVSDKHLDPPAPSYLPASTLNHKVNTRLSKTDIRAVFAEIARQAHVSIEVASSVPTYRLDAYLMSTSLKYALDRITGATGLTWNLTPSRSIMVNPPPTSRVELIKP